jgi:hypothetical protein
MEIASVAGLVILLAVRSSNAAQTPRDTLSKIDFNRDIRPLLTENCFKCHGPDDDARKARLRFDVRADALKPAKSGQVAIVPGSPERSELIARITATDLDDRMPPIKSGKKLTPNQIELLRHWIAQGATYATHWAYVKPARPPLPMVKNLRWPRNPIDRFILSRLEREGLKPSVQADRSTLIRRVSLDLTGLPPTIEEVDRFLSDKSSRAYEKVVDRLLASPVFGEHWARLWLDLARYADSAGYADDPPRTIWAYRDYVIKAFNANKPFDRFTREQIAGDLLDGSEEEDLVATAFHRNTMTNNEGGTDDEEFRNAAVVDRVNTTMSVWMATSMGCAQCHTHKYDPISQQEYFRFFAFFNNTEDADRKDEAPVLELYPDSQKLQRTKWQSEISAIQTKLKTPTQESLASQKKWEQNFPLDLDWAPLKPVRTQSRNNAAMSISDDSAVHVMPEQKTESYTVEFPVSAKQIAGLRIEAGASKPSVGQRTNGSFVISRLAATLLPPAGNRTEARFIRIELPGKEKILSLAEVQVFHGNENLALGGEASQSSVSYDGPARLAIDGNTDGDYENAKSTTHTDEKFDDPWWEVDLKSQRPIDHIVIWNRTDGEKHVRLSDFRILALDEKREPVWEKAVKEPPKPSADFVVDGSRSIRFAAVHADQVQPGFNPESILQDKAKKGWAVGSESGKPHYLTLVPEKAMRVAPGSRLQVVVEQMIDRQQIISGWFRVSASEDERMGEYARTPFSILEILPLPLEQRSENQQRTLTEYFLGNIDPHLEPDRKRLTELNKLLADLKPDTVPIMRELIGEKRRKSHLQLRGNFMALGEEVSEAVPAAFHPLARGKAPNRLALADWLVDENNPLTARVLANRLWEQIFGIGIVRTSEDFGSQGDAPTHPELLDWLACELRDGSLPNQELSVTDHAWDLKAFLKLLVTSAAYCQSSRVSPELMERDPDNLLLARGPRFRMTAEVVRDQALAVSGLLSPKLYGPSVRPPQPSLGLTAAFGSSLDWKTSDGEDRYRRALYVEWRRTSPYPSMATFDAPNREVCTLRRPRSNTPLQALVTLNDPVYVEAAQALARRMAKFEGTDVDRAQFGFRLCLARLPHLHELQALVDFYAATCTKYASEPKQAKDLAGLRASTLDEKELSRLAAWTAVANVLLNLDETLMKP